MSKMNKFTRREMISGTAAALAVEVCRETNRLFAAEIAGANLRPRVRPLPSDGTTPIPLLGLGCAERFPMQASAGRSEKDARAYAESMVDYAFKHGVNWFDTGYFYHKDKRAKVKSDKGKSEPFLGEVLKKYPRASFLLSTKLPTMLIKTREDAVRIFEDQLQRCQVDYFDFYLLHSINKKSEFERVYVQLGVLDYLIEQKKKGRIRHLGMSYHGKSDYLDELLKTYPGVFEVCMLMQNAMEFVWNKDAHNLSATAAKHGVAVLVMEPLAGGRAAGLRGESLEIIKRTHPNDSPARWGFRFAASLPGVVCVFSGMGRLEYLKENIQTLSEDFKPLSDEERKTYEAAIAAYMKYKSIPCSGCNYCVPCPYGVPIPELFAWYNEWAQNGRLPADDGSRNDAQSVRRRFLASYYNTFAARERADRCLGCKKCLVSCPQWTFRIPVEMEKISDLISHVEDVYVQKGGVIR